MARPSSIKRLENLTTPTKTQRLELMYSGKLISIMDVVLSYEFSNIRPPPAPPPPPPPLLPPVSWQDEPDSNSNTTGQDTLIVYLL
jgi:hypothetical protein